MCTAERGFKPAKVPSQQRDAINPKSMSASFRFRYGYKRLETTPHASSLGFNPTLSAMIAVLPGFRSRAQRRATRLEFERTPGPRPMR
jgi:hypothetical protein